MSPTTDCAGDCGTVIDFIEDTHYRVGEESRPVPDPDDAEIDDWFARCWFLCESCASGVLPDVNP